LNRYALSIQPVCIGIAENPEQLLKLIQNIERQKPVAFRCLRIPERNGAAHKLCI